MRNFLERGVSLAPHRAHAHDFYYPQARVFWPVAMEDFEMYIQDVELSVAMID